MVNMLKKIKQTFIFLNASDYVFLILIFTGILGAILSSTPIRKGDGTEYMLATETIFFDKGIEYNDKVFNRHLNLRAGSLDAVGFMFNKGKNNNYYLTQHPLYYSAFSVPLYGLIHILNPKLAYWSFFITNMSFIMIVILYLIYYLKKELKNKDYILLTFAFIFFSTVFSYIFWQHPETFLFFTVSSFFFFLYVLKRPVFAAIFLGLSTGQSLVLVFLGLNLIFYTLKNNKSLQDIAKKSIFILLAFVPTASFHYLVSYYLTGKFFALQNNANFSLGTLKDIMPALFDPSVGLIWFYPMVIFTVFNMKKDLKSFVVLFSTLISLVLYMINNQFYTHQVGLRYLNYIYPAFFFILDGEKLKKLNIKNIIILALSVFLTLGINMDIRLNNDGMNISQKNFVAYKWIKRLLPQFYFEHPQVFIHHSMSIINLNDPKNQYPTAFRIFADNNLTPGTIYEDNNWIVGDKWVRFLFNPVKPGKLVFKFATRNKKSEARVNGKIFTSNKGILEINIKPSDINHSQKTDMYTFFTDYLYIDFKFESWCPCESGSSDKRLLGNSFEEIINNGKTLYKSETKFGEN